MKLCQRTGFPLVGCHPPPQHDSPSHPTPFIKADAPQGDAPLHWPKNEAPIRWQMTPLPLIEE